MDDAEPLNDAQAVNYSAFDAEAVLLALGSVLEWKVDSYSLFCFRASGGEGGGCYSVRLWRAEYEARWFPWGVPKNTLMGTLHLTVTAAKAACERHHATGKWE